MLIPNAIALGTCWLLKAITNSRIHQNLLKYWFTITTLCHGWPCSRTGKKRKRKRSKPSDKPGRFLLHDFFQRKVNFPPLCDALRFSFLAVVSTVSSFLFFSEILIGTCKILLPSAFPTGMLWEFSMMFLFVEKTDG